MSRRVALQPASLGSSTPLNSTLTPGMQHFANVVEGMEAKYGKSRRKKRAKRRKRLTKADKKLIRDGAKLQAATAKKFKIANFVKKSRGKKSAKPCIDNRTTLLSLIRKVPGASKPLTHWFRK